MCVQQPPKSVTKELRFPHNKKLLSVVVAETVVFSLFPWNAARDVSIEGSGWVESNISEERFETHNILFLVSVN